MFTRDEANLCILVYVTGLESVTVKPPALADGAAVTVTSLSIELRLSRLMTIASFLIIESPGRGSEANPAENLNGIVLVVDAAAAVMVALG